MKPEKTGRTYPSAYPVILLFGILLGIWVFRHSIHSPALAAGRPVRAGLDELLPLIIGAIWVIMQVAGAAAQKKKKSAPSSGEAPQDRRLPDDRDFDPPAREQPPENPLGDFLRQFTDGDEFRMPEPRVPETPRPAAVQRPSGMNTEQIDALPDMSTRGIPEANVLPIEQKASIAEAVKEIEKVETDIRPKMSTFRGSVPSIKLPSMPSAGLRIDNPSYAEASRGQQGIGDELHLKDRNALRRAMLSHIIFSPPKALEQTRTN